MAEYNINLGIFAVAGGTADVITAAYTPTTLSLYNGLYKQFRASGANTLVAPTLNIDGLGAKPIVKKGGNALVVGDIAGAGHVCEVSYNSTSEKWELLNPASDASGEWEQSGTLVKLKDESNQVRVGQDTGFGVPKFEVYATDGETAIGFGDLNTGGYMWLRNLGSALGFVLEGSNSAFWFGCDLFPSTDNAHDLGVLANRWRDLFLSRNLNLYALAGGGVRFLRVDNNGLVSAVAGDDTKADKIITRNRQTASYALVASDADKLVEMNVGSANNLTVPANVFSDGQQILISQYGAGQTTIVAGAGMTLRVNPGLKLSAQYSMATIVFISATEAYVSGDLTA